MFQAKIISGLNDKLESLSSPSDVLASLSTVLSGLTLAFEKAYSSDLIQQHKEAPVESVKVLEESFVQTYRSYLFGGYIQDSLFILLASPYVEALKENNQKKMALYEYLVDAHSQVYTSKAFLLLDRSRADINLSVYGTLTAILEPLLTTTVDSKPADTFDWLNMRMPWLKSKFSPVQAMKSVPLSLNNSELFSLLEDYVKNPDSESRLRCEEALEKKTIYRKSLLSWVCQDLPGFLASEYYTLQPYILGTLAKADYFAEDNLVDWASHCMTQKAMDFFVSLALDACKNERDYSACIAQLSLSVGTQQRHLLAEALLDYPAIYSRLVISPLENYTSHFELQFSIEASEIYLGIKDLLLHCVRGSLVARIEEGTFPTQISAEAIFEYREFMVRDLNFMLSDISRSDVGVVEAYSPKILAKLLVIMSPLDQPLSLFVSILDCLMGTNFEKQLIENTYWTKNPDSFVIEDSRGSLTLLAEAKKPQTSLSSEDQKSVEALMKYFYSEVSRGLLHNWTPEAVLEVDVFRMGYSNIPSKEAIQAFKDAAISRTLEDIPRYLNSARRFSLFSGHASDTDLASCLDFEATPKQLQKPSYGDHWITIRDPEAFKETLRDISRQLNPLNEPQKQAFMFVVDRLLWLTSLPAQEVLQLQLELSKRESMS